MKKKILFGFLTLAVLGLAGLVWLGVQNDKADVVYDKTLTVPAQAIKVLRLSSLEQPAKVIVRESEQAETTVHISGRLAKNNIDAMEEQFGIDDEGDLLISFAKDGFSVTVMGEKPTVTIEINLAKGVSFEDFSYFSSNGGADISLPASFDGIFQVRGGKISKPENGINQKRQAKIETQKGDVSITLN